MPKTSIYTPEVQTRGKRTAKKTYASAVAASIRLDDPKPEEKQNPNNFFPSQEETEQQPTALDNKSDKLDEETLEQSALDSKSDTLEEEPSEQDTLGVCIDLFGDWRKPRK